MEHYLKWKLQKYPSSMNEPSFIWPPRCYPCTFCRREFRSAQALGGHMNVHRRDRARLKHSPPPPARIQESGGPENLPARTISTTPPNADEDDFAETNAVCKRHKRCSSMEEIDLELRLGAPAVKVGQFY